MHYLRAPGQGLSKGTAFLRIYSAGGIKIVSTSSGLLIMSYPPYIYNHSLARSYKSPSMVVQQIERDSQNSARVPCTVKTTSAAGIQPLTTLYRVTARVVRLRQLCKGGYDVRCRGSTRPSTTISRQAKQIGCFLMFSAQN